MARAAAALWLVVVTSSVLLEKTLSATLDRQHFAAEVQLENVNLGAISSSLEEQITLPTGLAWDYYSQSCPEAQNIIAQQVSDAIREDPGVAPGLIRIFFHDCFSRGCDASLLLRDSRGSELNDPPNRSLRRSALDLIDQIKAALEHTCRGVVSCADIITASARDSITFTKGPVFDVPLGRLDSFTRFSTNALPSAYASFDDQLNRFRSFGLDILDLVALAPGAHTLGVAHCSSFEKRLFPTVDPKLNKKFAEYLLKVCGAPASNTTPPVAVSLDIITPFDFDNQNYKNLLGGAALLQSDQNMDTNTTAWNLVKSWAANKSAFFDQFAKSFVRMSEIRPLTGNAGEIRRICSRSNRVEREDLYHSDLPVKVMEGEELANSPEFGFIKEVTDEE